MKPQYGPFDHSLGITLRHQNEKINEELKGSLEAVRARGYDLKGRGGVRCDTFFSR